MGPKVKKSSWTGRRGSAWDGMAWRRYLFIYLLSNVHTALELSFITIFFQIIIIKFSLNVVSFLIR